MAITTNDVNTALQKIIVNSPIDNLTKVIQLSPNSFVSVSTFVSIFVNSIDMTAVNLHAIDNGILGYSTYIDEWKQARYIN